MGKHFALPKTKFLVIRKNFISGWNPLQDPKWLEWSENFNKLNKE